MDPDETITAQQFRDGMNQVAAEVAGTVADEVQHNLSGQLGNERANEAFRNTLNSELDSYDGLTDRGRPMLRSLVFESVNRALRPDDRENAKTAIRDLCLEAGWFLGEPAGGRKKPAGTAGVLAVNAAGATVQKPEDVDLLNPTEVARAIR